MTDQGGQITIRDVYDAQKQTDGKVDTIAVQVAAFTGEVKARLDNGQSKLDDHERRLRSLEASKNKLTGMTIGIAALSGTVAAIIAAIIEHH